MDDLVAELVQGRPMRDQDDCSPGEHGRKRGEQGLFGLRIHTLSRFVEE